MFTLINHKTHKLPQKGITPGAIPFYGIPPEVDTFYRNIIFLDTFLVLSLEIKIVMGLYK